MLAERDPFEFILARDLGLTLAAVGQMSNREYLDWRAFYTYERAMDPRTWKGPVR